MRYFLRVAFMLLAVAVGRASITSQIDQSPPYIVLGLPSTVPVPFPFQQGSDLRAYDIGSVSTPRSPAALLVLGSDYTVTGGGYNSAVQMQVGSIQVVTTGISVVIANDQIVIMRGVPINQITSFSVTGPLTISLIEQALDKQAMLSQQVNQAAASALHFEPQESLSTVLPKATRANTALTFDTNGAVNLIPVSAFTTATDISNDLVTATGSSTAITLGNRYAGIVNVKDYGAKGDGVTDDTTAIQQAILHAENQTAVNPNRVIYFPQGVYFVTVPHVLSSFSVTVGGLTTTGLTFRGDGMFNSIIRCSFGGFGGGWLFDNAQSGSEFQQIEFHNLGFEGMNPASYTGFSSLPTNVGLFKITRGALSTQGFMFYGCRFDVATWGVEIDGSNNASENKFIGCKFYRMGGPVYTINNAQAFNNEFVSTDIEQVYNDVFLVTTGGAVKMTGGSIIMFADGTSTDRWLFHMTGSVGLGAYPFIFSGLRCEFRGNFSNLCNITNTQQATVTFSDSLFELQSTVDKTSFCSVAAYGMTTFRGCSFNELNAGKMDFICGASDEFGQSGEIVFDSCGLFTDWSDRCSVSTFYGTIRAINCHGDNIGVVVGDPQYYAWDFDLNGVTSSHGTVSAWANSGASLVNQVSSASNAPRLKTAYLRTPTDWWTITTTPKEISMKLPRNAIIKDIFLLKPGGGGDANALTWKVGNNDKTTAHLTTASTANNVALQASTTNYFYAVGTTTNERLIRVWASAGTPSATMQGGFVVIDYY